MPLVANTKLPSFSRYRAEGGEVLTPRRAQEQSIRELHIGLFNMMPDAALEPTERQFLRLVGGCNRIAQFYIYPLPPAQSPVETRPDDTSISTIFRQKISKRQVWMR